MEEIASKGPSRTSRNPVAETQPSDLRPLVGPIRRRSGAAVRRALFRHSCAYSRAAVSPSLPSTAHVEQARVRAEFELSGHQVTLRSCACSSVSLGDGKRRTNTSSRAEHHLVETVRNVIVMRNCLAITRAAVQCATLFGFDLRWRNRRRVSRPTTTTAREGSRFSAGCESAES